jgi:hypothetical protein
MAAERLTAQERETHIVFNDADDFALVTTHMRTWLTALENNPAAEQVGKTDAFGGKTFRVEKALVAKVRNGRRKRTETPEALAARMDKARQARGRK